MANFGRGGGGIGYKFPPAFPFYLFKKNMEKKKGGRRVVGGGGVGNWYIIAPALPFSFITNNTLSGFENSGI